MYLSIRYKATFSSLIIGLIALVIITIDFSNSHWNEPKRVIVDDVISYYAYLPAFFIYHDLSFEFVTENPEYYSKYFWVFSTPTGNEALLTTMGLSMLYFPFFIIAHSLAPMLGYINDGYSAPYKFALVFSSLVYLLFGLYFLRKILLRFFSDRVTGFTILCIVFGTNLLHYTTREAAMSHVYSFSLISVFLYLVIRWYQSPGLKISLFLGAIAGLIVLIRPTNILILLLFILWGVSSFRSMWERFGLLIKNYGLILLMAVSFIAVWVPQFIYWYSVSGSIFYYSYEESGGNFFFNNPQIIPQLFSYRKGWFLYTPMMAVAILGLIFGFRKNKTFALPIAIYLVAMIYILSSWWSWWSGGSFGLRFYIDAYGIMALPLAAVIAFFLNQKIILKISGMGIIGLLLIFNLFQTYQYHKGVIHFSGMNKLTYWNVFGKTERPVDFYRMLDEPDYEKAREGIYVNKPKNIFVPLTEENCFEEMVKQISANKKWMEEIKAKARERNITVEEMLKLDAKWWCGKHFSKEQNIQD